MSEARLVPIEPAGPLADLKSLRMGDWHLWQQFVERPIFCHFHHLVGGCMHQLFRGSVCTRASPYPCDDCDLQDLPAR
jgi:hypothetical protein